MRSELEQIEQIDQYLGGKMSPDQIASFESKMNADPALKSLVKDQQLLIQTVSRKALLAEINTVAGLAAGVGAGAGASAGGWGAIQWVIAGISVAAAGVGGTFIYNSIADGSDQNSTEIAELTQDSTSEEDLTLDTSKILFKMAVNENPEEEVEENASFEDSDGENTLFDGNEMDELSDDQDPLNNFSALDKPENNGYQHTADYETTETTTSNIQKNRQASFPGGHIAMQKWFEKNMMYPGTAKLSKVQGTVEVRFYVSMSGEIEIVGSECKSLYDEEGHLLTGLKRAKYRKSIKLFRRTAEKSFRICPKWIAATNTHGSAIVSEQVWYVKFVLNGKSEVYSFGNDSGSIYENNEPIIDEENDVHFDFYTLEDNVIEPANR
jgi:hypothetical protein